MSVNFDVLHTEISFTNKVPMKTVALLRDIKK